jgi:hypothetical protein
MVGYFHITLVGVISDEAYHKSAACIKELEKKFEGLITSTQMAFFPTQWDNYLKKLQNDKKGLFYEHKGSPIIFLNNETYVGGEE